MRPLFLKQTNPNRYPFNDDGKVLSIEEAGVRRVVTEPDFVFRDEARLPNGSFFVREVMLKPYGGITDRRRMITEEDGRQVICVCEIVYSSALGVFTPNRFVEVITADGPPVFYGKRYHNPGNGQDSSHAKWDKRYAAHRYANAYLLLKYSQTLGNDNPWTHTDPAIVNHVHWSAGSI